MSDTQRDADAPAATPRMTGRRLQARRLRWWRRNPLCGASDGGNARSGPDSVCAREGVVRVWTQLDHIVPLHKEGPDTDANVQGLCDECHELKTRRDMGYSGPPPQRIGLDGYPVERSRDGNAEQGDR